LFFLIGNYLFNSIGFYDEHLSCWRPRVNSIFDEVRRFFIGGSTELEDITYVAIPKLFESGKVM
jgi:Meckel syndrome type 1 protein